MLPKEISTPRNWGRTLHSWSLFSGMQQRQRRIKCLQELWTGTPGGCLITNGWYRFEFQEHLCCFAPKYFLCLFVYLLFPLLFALKCFICLFVFFVVCPRMFPMFVWLFPLLFAREYFYPLHGSESRVDWSALQSLQLSVLPFNLPKVQGLRIINQFPF